MSKARQRSLAPWAFIQAQRNGIQGNLSSMIENYFKGVIQRVVLNGIESEWKPILSGVPRGSVLNPLSFLVYINDLT